MPRNSSGTYSLPAGNPVVTGTVISSTWANTTLSDIATEMTDSLDRSGKGGMLAALQLASGVIGTPGLSWTAETNSGLYRAGAGDFRYSIAAADKVQITTNGLRTADGVIGTPGFSFIADTDTGFYRSGGNEFKAACGATDAGRFGFSTTAFFQIADGVFGQPGLGFISDTDTGMYRIGANNQGFVVGGTLAFSTRLGADSLGKVDLEDGSATQPVLTFRSDTDTGVYRIGANSLGITTGGISAVEILDTQTLGIPLRLGTLTAAPNNQTACYIGVSTSAFTGFNGDLILTARSSAASAIRFYSGAGGAVTEKVRIENGGQLGHSDGTVGTPGISFISDPDTGFYRSGANDARLVAGGTFIAGWQLDGSSRPFFYVADGVAAQPALTFGSDPDTGFYRDTANQIGIALGGATAGQIVSGSFTANTTGFTANPSGTATYQRFGNMVMLQLPQLSGTSNATTLTVTGLPAIITPSASRYVPVTCTDNGTAQTGVDTGVIISAAGAMTFIRAGGSTNWTAAGTKAIQQNGGVPNTICYLV